MRLTLLAIGSRGDVQPLVALGRGLLRAGHKVRLATFNNFRSLVESAGIEFAQIEGGCQEMLESDEGRDMIESGGNIVRQIQAVRAISRKLISLPGYWESYQEACRNADAIVYRDCTPHGFIFSE